MSTENTDPVTWHSLTNKADEWTHGVTVHNCTPAHVAWLQSAFSTDTHAVVTVDGTDVTIMQTIHAGIEPSDRHITAFGLSVLGDLHMIGHSRHQESFRSPTDADAVFGMLKEAMEREYADRDAR